MELKTPYCLASNQAVNEYFEKLLPEMTNRYKRETERI